MPSAPEYLPEQTRAIWVGLVEAGAHPGPGFDAYCGQVAIERDCASRVMREGVVVADAKGAPVPHPALVVQRKAQAEIRAWGDRFYRPTLPQDVPTTATSRGSVRQW